MRRLIFGGLLLAGALLFGAQGQVSWPPQPIKIIVGFAAGGRTDVTVLHRSSVLPCDLNNAVKSIM